MSNMSNNYGSNVAFQDLFDVADEDEDGAFPPLVTLDTTDSAALLHTLTHRMRELVRQNRQLKAENESLKMEIEKMKTQ